MGHHHHKHRNMLESAMPNENLNQPNNPSYNQIPAGNQNPSQNQDINQNANFNAGPFADLLKNVDMNQISSILSGFNTNIPSDMNEADRSTYIINSLKSFLPDERGRILDEILRIYTLSKNISSQ